MGPETGANTHLVWHVLETGERTAAVDVMQKAWTGDWPTHQAPQIQSLRLNAEEAPKSIEGAVNQVFHAEVHATESDDHLISWRVRGSPNRAAKRWWRFEPTPPTIEAVIGTQNRQFNFQLSEPGEYRLFCQIDTPHDSSAVANIPFLIKPEPQKRRGSSVCSEEALHDN